jgi:KamA family protein
LTSSTPNPSKTHLTWRAELTASLQFAQTAATDLPLDSEDCDRITAAQTHFPFLVPMDYAQLIDWQDPQDPLRQLLLPSAYEDEDQGALDTSGEALSTVVPGLQHKYEQTAVLIVTQACAGHCRYCFRRRLMSKDVMVKETIEDLQAAIAYIHAHPEIDNVLLSGGDPMVCSTQRLANLFATLANIPHLWQIRISTKLPAFLPSRFTTDPALLQVLAQYQDRFQIVFQCHFDHPREITLATEQALATLREVGCILTAQIPLMQGVNATVDVLEQLFKRLHRLGVLPQYLFHPRPVKHALHFQLPIAAGLQLVEAVRQRCNGSVKRFRYILTHTDGKLELVGLTPSPASQLIGRWHQQRRGCDRPEILLWPLDNQMVWLPDPFSASPC